MDVRKLSWITTRLKIFARSAQHKLRAPKRGGLASKGLPPSNLSGKSTSLSANRDTAFSTATLSDCFGKRKWLCSCAMLRRSALKAWGLNELEVLKILVLLFFLSVAQHWATERAVAQPAKAASNLAPGLTHQRPHYSNCATQGNESKVKQHSVAAG